MYTCKCAPYFYGSQCEIFITPDYVLEFTSTETQNFVKINGPNENLNEVSSVRDLIFSISFLFDFYIIDFSLCMDPNKRFV